MERAYDHSEFRDRVGAYVLGALGGEERAAFEAHAAACTECAALLAEAAAQDASLRELFAGAAPAAGFEDRLVARLRSARQPWPVLHPMVRRAATGVAAAVMLGGFGFVASRSMQNGALPLPWERADRVHAASNLTNIGQGIVQFGNESKGERSGETLVDGLLGGLQAPADMAKLREKLKDLR